MSYAGVESSPGWIEWAERETVARLKDQLSTLRAERELRRAAELEADEPKTDESVEEPELSLPRVISAPARTPKVSAINDPPSHGTPEWETWADAQTVLRLRHEIAVRRGEAVMPEPAVELQVQAPMRTIRINLENLRSVGV